MDVDEENDASREEQLRSNVLSRKGRGFTSETDHRPKTTATSLAAPETDAAIFATKNIQRSVEGWVLFVTGLHEESDEDTLYDLVADYAKVRSVKRPINTRTGLSKDYGFVLCEDFDGAMRAVAALNGRRFQERTLGCAFAFCAQ